MGLVVRRMVEGDLDSVVDIASKSFHGMRDRAKARMWIECNLRCSPRMQYFVAEDGGRILGYILWVERGGFREEAVLELEQIAVRPEFRGQGVATELIKRSLGEVRRYLEDRGSKLKLVLVMTGSEHGAQHLYEKALNVEVECVIRDLFRGDEAVMVARYKP